MQPLLFILSARAEVLLDTVDAVRKAVGKAFPISVKLNSADFQQGGFSEADAAQVAQWLYERGVDLLEVSGGSYESNTICTDSSTIGQHKDFGTYGSLLRIPEFLKYPCCSSSSKSDRKGRLRESTRKREAYYALFCANLRKSVPGLPVMLTGGFRSRQVSALQLLLFCFAFAAPAATPLLIDLSPLRRWRLRYWPVRWTSLA